MKPADDVVFHIERGEAFLLHLESGQYFSLNESGTVAWQALARGEDPVTALEAARPDIGVEEHRRDWEALCRQLTDAGLIEG